MKRENEISVQQLALIQSDSLIGIQYARWIGRFRRFGYLTILLLILSNTAQAQCKLKETKISGSEIKLVSSQGIKLTGNGKDYTCKFIKFGSNYFVSVNYINKAVKQGIFTIDDSCPLVFLLDNNQKVILYPVNPLMVDPVIGDYLFGQKETAKIYYNILPLQIEQLTSSFYTDVHLYFKSEIKPDKSVFDTWGTYFSYNTRKNRQMRHQKKLECMLEK
ncbi:MAG: hypothetical protein FJY07_14615 [Bacteroidetes bacterium]|nr:hypothetical protein [Bacteroidota bacterium]